MRKFNFTVTGRKKIVGVIYKSSWTEALQDIKLILNNEYGEGFYESNIITCD